MLRRAVFASLLLSCQDGGAAPASSASALPTATGAIAVAASSAAAAPSEKEARVAAIQAVMAFVDAASDRGVKLDGVKVYTEETDPNKLLGRPGQYLAKTSWKISGGDATIEAFANAPDARARAAYVEKIGKSSPMFLEYVFVNETRFTVLRLPKSLSPSGTKIWREMQDG